MSKRWGRDAPVLDHVKGKGQEHRPGWTSTAAPAGCPLTTETRDTPTEVQKPRGPHGD